jgi:ribosomal protein L16 Arg81 hydroxylase
MTNRLTLLGGLTIREFLRNYWQIKWTVLVQGLNHHLPEAAELLKHFDFMPHPRMDDLMVSYAAKGGEAKKLLAGHPKEAMKTVQIVRI